MGQLGVCKGSVDQVRSAVGLESPLSPEAPGLFDDPLNHWAAHFEASQLKFKWGDFTFNKLTTTDEGGSRESLHRLHTANRGKGEGDEVLKREKDGEAG